MVRGHRDDIDGLRSVAVLPVLFYHAGIGPFAAGYVGVDVFFVISGYLITGLILRGGAARGFSLVDFYDRRIRRILPALFAVLALSTVAALFILLPDELKLYGNSLLSSVLFAANIYFWNRYDSYFAPDAEQNPLRHVWSLSVEEQFYLLWPLLLMGLSRHRRALIAAILVLGGASLAAALYVAGFDPNASFYLLPMRAWQLLAGALLAAAVLRPPRAVLVRNILALAAIAVVLAATIVEDGAAHFHAWNSIGAAFGTALLLYAADGGSNAVSTVLGSAVPAFIGRISYSLYLWHWPAFVFLRLALNRDLTPWESLALLAAVFGVSVLSWRYIEQPARRYRGTWRGWPASLFAAAAAAGSALAVALVLILTGGLPQRLAPDLQIAARDAEDATTGHWCRIVEGGAVGCLLGDARARGEIVLWGDSHARSLIPGMLDLAKARGLRLRAFTEPSCEPLPNVDQRGPHGGPNPRCSAFNKAVFAAILRDRTARMVVLESHWQILLSEHRIDPPIVARAEGDLDGVVTGLERAGLPVVLVANVAQFPNNPWHCYGRERLFGRDPTACERYPRASVGDVGSQTDAMLARVAARHPRLRFYAPSKALCDSRACWAVADGRLLYGDAQHLAKAGAKRVAQGLARTLRGWP